MHLQSAVRRPVRLRFIYLPTHLLVDVPASASCCSEATRDIVLLCDSERSTQESWSGSGKQVANSFLWLLQEDDSGGLFDASPRIMDAEGWEGRRSGTRCFMPWFHELCCLTCDRKCLAVCLAAWGDLS